MASGGKPDGKKPPAKGVSSRRGARKNPSGKGKPKSGTKRATGKTPAARRKLPSLPMLAAWILAVFFLAATIYFSRNTSPLNTDRTTARSTAETRKQEHASGVEKSVPEPVRGTQGKKAEMGEKAGNPGHAPLPTGPIIPPKPAFSSRDLPSDPPPSKDLLALNRPSPATKPPSPQPPTAPVMGMVAIVIDDFGPDVEIARKFLSLPFPVTLSILPFQAHSAEIAQLAHSQGREVFLHLPMEPHGHPKTDPGRGALLLSMSEDAIRLGIGSALDTSPHFRGVNNHMGSKMTENSKVMKTVLEELNRRGLMFLDSYTSPKSKGFSVAKEIKMPALRRDIFLDHDPSAKSVRSQLSRLIRMARIKGTALAIGHPHGATLNELREAAGEFGKQGIKIVPAGELMTGR